MGVGTSPSVDSSPGQDQSIPILPYSLIVGQATLKLALELAYIAPRLGGVLLRGLRGTGKSTAVRAFGRMIYGDLPITLQCKQDALDCRIEFARSVTFSC